MWVAKSNRISGSIVMMTPPIITRWRRLRPLGRGASGAAVSLAVDTSSGLLFAVKSAAAGGSLRRELSVLSSLPPHPHLIPLLPSPSPSEHIFLHYAPGGALSDLIDLRGPLDELSMRRHVFGVLSALAHVHAHSVAHCDVKPANILIARDGAPLLADFGCARASPPPPRGEAIMGTPAYLAPEAARGEEQGPAADVWALGCTAVEMAAGRPPYAGSDAASALYRIGYDACYAPEVPAWLSEDARDFVGRCLRRDPRERPTAEELLKHPFAAAAAAAESGFGEKQELRISPRSTLEESGFWGGSETEEEEEEEEEEEPRGLDGRAEERIGELAAAAAAGRGLDAPEWTADDEGWIAVRECSRDRTSGAASAGEISGGDSDGGGGDDSDGNNDNRNDDNGDFDSGGMSNEGIIDDDEEEERFLGLDCNIICAECSFTVSKTKEMNATLCHSPLFFFFFFF